MCFYVPANLMHESKQSNSSFLNTSRYLLHFVNSFNLNKPSWWTALCKLVYNLLRFKGIFHSITLKFAENCNDLSCVGYLKKNMFLSTVLNLIRTAPVRYSGSSKYCNAKFFQICSDKEKLIYILDGLKESFFSKLIFSVPALGKLVIQAPTETISTLIWKLI